MASPIRKAPTFAAGVALLLILAFRPAIAQPLVTVDTTPTLVQGQGFETYIAANPCDHREAVGVWIPTPGQCPENPPLCETLEGMSFTTDGGVTWTAYEMLDRWQTDPTVAFHPFGDFAFNPVMRGFGAENGVRRVEMGPPFDVSNLSIVAPAGVVDRTSIVSGVSRVDGQTVYAYFAYAKGTDPERGIHIRRTPVIQETPEQWAQRDLDDWPGSIVQPSGANQPELALDDEGRIHLAFIPETFPFRVKYTYSEDDASSWAPIEEVSNAVLGFDFVVQEQFSRHSGA